MKGKGEGEYPKICPKLFKIYSWLASQCGIISTFIQQVHELLPSLWILIPIGLKYWQSGAFELQHYPELDLKVIIWNIIDHDIHMTTRYDYWMTGGGLCRRPIIAFAFVGKERSLCPCNNLLFLFYLSRCHPRQIMHILCIGLIYVYILHFTLIAAVFW